jgi:hypothetical protein
MVKGVKVAFVVPRVRRRMETNFGGRVSLDFTKERNFAIKVGIPRDRANRRSGGRGKSGILAQGLSV